MNNTISDIEIFEIILLIAIALIFARLFGYILDRFKQPPVIGEIIAGFFLGGLGLGIIAGKSFILFNWKISIPQLPYNSDSFTFCAQIGILFLMFLSGLGTNISELKKVGKSSLFVATGGVILPLILGMLVAYLYGFTWQISLVIGLILVATSVGVPVRVLMDLHMLNSEAGLTILGAAVIDDIIGIILFVTILGVASPMDITFLGFKIIVFFILFLFIGFKLINKFFDLGEKIQLPKALLSLSLSFFLLYSFFAFQSGIAGITGAFVAGLVIGHSAKSKKIIDDVKTIGYGLFIPLFFVWVGANVDSNEFGNITIIIFICVIILVAIAGKVIGCGLGAKLARMTNLKALQVGIGMVPRLEMALIIVGVAVSQGILVGEVAQQLIATTVILTVVTTLITPFLLKAVLKKEVKS